jgi:hypothetical protein
MHAKDEPPGSLKQEELWTSLQPLARHETWDKSGWRQCIHTHGTSVGPAKAARNRFWSSPGIAPAQNTATPPHAFQTSSAADDNTPELLRPDFYPSYQSGS